MQIVYLTAIPDFHLWLVAIYAKVWWYQIWQSLCVLTRVCAYNGFRSNLGRFFFTVLSSKKLVSSDFIQNCHINSISIQFQMQIQKKYMHLWKLSCMILVTKENKKGVQNLSLQTFSPVEQNMQFIIMTGSSYFLLFFPLTDKVRKVLTNKQRSDDAL